MCSLSPKACRDRVQAISRDQTPTSCPRGSINEQPLLLWSGWGTVDGASQSMGKGCGKCNAPPHATNEGIAVTTIPFTPKSASSTLVITSSPITGDLRGMRCQGWRLQACESSDHPRLLLHQSKRFGLKLQYNICCGWCGGSSCDWCSQCTRHSPTLIRC